MKLSRRRIAKREDIIIVKHGIRIDQYCEYCGKPAGWDTFKTQKSIKEFNTSGYCQACQDEIRIAWEEENSGPIQEIPTENI